MYLKSLEISGFKSFAGKASLSFTAPITSIVGPNGSGKSNVAEAFRYVLGEQSMKSMRGRRTEDLIWNGSRSTPKSNRASVKLRFDNTPHETEAGVRRLFDIDFDEVIIERIIHRDASSEYQLNGSPVRLKDIIELLAAAHIGASGHHIISQGEADRVLSVNTRERRGMIEDALGLKIYQYKKEESERKLEKTRENLEKAEGLRREIKPHLMFLSKQVQKIEKAQELANELAEKLIEYFAREHVHIERERTALSTEKKPLEDRMHTVEKELTHARKELERLETKDTTSDDLLKAEEELRTVRKEKDTITEETGCIEGEIVATKRQLEREAERRAKGDLRTVPWSAVSELHASVLKDIESLGSSEDVGAFKRIVATFKEKLTALIERFRGDDTPHAEEKELESTLKKLMAQKETLLSNRNSIEAREASLSDTYKKVQKTIEDDKDSGREMERTVFALSGVQQDIRLSLQTLSAREDALKAETEEWKRDIGEASALLGTRIAYEAQVATFRNEPVEDRHEQHERKRLIERMKIRLEESGLGGSDDLMKEYKEVGDRDAFLEREIADLYASADSLEGLIKELNTTLSLEFERGVEKINTEFQTFFSLMFGGGEAELALVKEKVKKEIMYDEDGEPILSPETDNEDTEPMLGVEIKVALPRKKIRGLEMLSGGERALTSIALIFAMSQVNPPPFVILDETDAALDEANSKRYGDMIENLAKRTQLILITHNRETMSRAGVLYGVTMDAHAASQLLSVSFTEAIAVAK
ncbi:MAG: AAA family ATPase [Patescibacteria group bacterium]